MPRKYIKLLGSSGYQNYSDETLQRALKEVSANKCSVREASRKFGVPKSTLSDHLKASRKGIKLLSPGGQPVLTEMEENVLVDGLILCAEWGYPLHASDVKDVVQDYLNREGRSVKQFTDNRPGEDWTWNFLKRNPTLTNRFAENIKRARAALDVETLEKYFDAVEETLAEVPPENLINFDETNFTDDPGSVKVITRRGSRHVERIIDHSKTSISVMFAATGSGELLPPFTVYKAQNLYPTWVEGGLAGARYATSKSGWFDMKLFEEWFREICLPYLKKRRGKRAIIGDNLASHINLEVIRLCQENDIAFILLPPNATHLLQSLDVGVFKPMKGGWRKTLLEWKQTNRGVVPKSVFPRLLKNTVERLGDKLSENIKAGFKATGLIPMNREEVLKRVPRKSTNDNSPETWSRALINRLEETRKKDTASDTASDTAKKRGKRLDVQPGKSISSEEAIRALMDEEEPEPAVSSDESDGDMEDDSQDQEEKEAEDSTDETEIEEGDFVLVKYVTEEDSRSKLYVGQVVNILGDDKWETKFMRKQTGRKSIWFSFPKIPDIETISPQSVIAKLESKESRRGMYYFPDIEDFASINNVS